MTERLESADGTEIAVSTEGRGPAVVVVDGAMATRDTHPSVPGLETILRDSATVVRYDRRGRGASGDGPSGVEREVADLAAVLGVCGGPVVLLGFSSGAVLALEAARAGLPISKLVLYEPPCVVTADRRPVDAGYPDRVAQLIADGDDVAALALFMTEPVGLPTEVVAQMSDDPGFRAGAAAARSLHHDARVMSAVSGGSPQALQRYASVRLPTLVLSGSRTEPWLTAAAAAVSAALPRGRHVVVDGQDHDPSATSIVPSLVEVLARA